MELLRALLPWLVLYLVVAIIISVGVGLVAWGAAGIIQDLPKGWNNC